MGTWGLVGEVEQTVGAGIEDVVVETIFVGRGRIGGKAGVPPEGENSNYTDTEAGTV